MPLQSPILALGSFLVHENDYLSISTAQINATDVDTTNPAHILFEVSGLTGGRFILNGLKVTQFTLADILADRVAFKHDGITTTPSFSISASDSNGNVSTSRSINILVEQINDAPVIVAKAVNLGRGLELVLSSSNLKITDEESADSKLVVKVLSAPHLSVLYKLSTGFKAVTSFTVADLNAGKIVIRHDNTTFSPRLNIQVDDPDGGSTKSSLSFRFTDTVAVSKNTAPVVDKGTFHVRDGETITVTSNMIHARDDRSDSGGIHLNVTNLNGGQFYLSGVKATLFSLGDIELGLVTFKHLVNQAVPDFTLNARDSHAKLASSLFTAHVDVEFINEAPGLWIRPVVMNEGGTIVFSESTLLVIDGDSPADKLIFEASNLNHGRLLVNQIDATNFSLLDVRNSKVKFIHDGGEEAPTLELSLKDELSYYTLGGEIANINVPFQFKNIDDLVLV